MVQQITPSQITAEAQHIIFVGREYEQQRYARFLTQDTPWVFLITAEPGSGKSTLLRHLAAQTEKSIPVVLLDFAQPWLRTDILTILEKLAEQLQPSCGTTPFQNFKQELEKYRKSLHASGKKMDKMIMAAEQAYREQMQQVAQAKTEYREQEQAIADVVKAFYALVEMFQPERLVVILDTSEWLYDPGEDPGEDETNRVGEWLMNNLLLELHQRMQQRGRRCFFVIASRSRLHVDEKYKQDVIEHTLHPLEQAEVEQYLQQKGMQDPALCKQVYEISHGHPFSLMLIAELWQRQKEQPASFLTFLDKQQGLDTPALRDHLGERLLDKNLEEPLNELTRYGVLLRKFDLPMLQAVFPECFSKGKEPQQLNQLISAAYILPREEYYAFDDLMRETLATRVRIYEPEKWRMYHKKARDYLTTLVAGHGTPYPLNGYYHALASNEKSGMDEWIHAIRKAYADGTREVLGALFLVAYDKTLDLSPAACAVRAYEQGHFYYSDQQWDEALKHYQQALDFYTKAVDTRAENARVFYTEAEITAGQAKVYVGMADVQRFRPDRDLEAALDYYQHAYDLSVGMDEKGVDNLLAQAHRLHEIGEVLRLQERLEAALESYSKALAIFQGFGYYQDMAYVHRSMAAALAQLSPNQKEAAIEHYQQALELLPGEGDPAGRAEMCKALGDLQRERQNWTTALQTYEQGLCFYQRDNNLVGQATLYQRMGEAEQASGKENTALAYYAKALEFYAHRKEELKGRSKEDVDYVTVQAGKADAYRAIGRIEQQQRHWDNALKNYEFAANVYRELGDEAKREDVGKARWETLRCIEWLKAIDERAVQKLWECLDRRDHRGAAYMCQQIGEELREHREDIALVLEAYQHARWYYGQASDEPGQAYASQQIAEIERSWGGLETAYADYQLALRAYSDGNDKPGMAYICQRMGEVEQLRGDSEQALQSFGDACKYYQQVGDKAREAYVQKVSGKIEQARGNWEKARIYYQAALALYQDLSDRAGEADVCKALGEIEQASANWSGAQKQFEAAKKIYHEELKDRLAEAYLCRVIGDVLLVQQQWEMARQSYDQALSFYGQGEMPAEQAHIYQGRGDALRKYGKPDKALNDYQESVRLYEMLKDDSGAVAVYRARAEIQWTRDLEAAQENARKAQILELIAGDQQTTPAPPLVAFARVTLKKDGQGFADKEYALQVRIAQKQREEPGSKEAGAESEKVRAVVDPLVIVIRLHADSTITWLEREDAQLLYNSRDSEQQVEFPFKMKAARHHTLDVDFTHKQRWVGTIHLKLDAVGQPLPHSAPKSPVTEQKVNLPLYDDFRVDVLLRVRLNGNGKYSAEVTVDRGNTYEPFSIELTEDEVASHTENLQEAIERVSQQQFGRKSFDTALAKLAEEGKDAWESIFKKGKAAIRGALKEEATIQAVVDKLDKFSVPWELLYDGPLGEGKVDVSRFWGMRYHIVRLLPCNSDDLVIKTPQSPTIGLIINKDLGGAREELGTLEKLKDQEKILLTLLRELDNHHHDDELEYLIRFLCEEELHILHLACHATANKPGDPYLVVSNDFQIRLGHLRNRNFEIKHHPLVVLNACLTGPINPLYASNWATLFWERGARGVLATEARVPDIFAARFLKKLYEGLLSGEPIGDELFRTRRYFWEEEHNPGGLVYALYASPSLKIEKTVSG